MKLNVEEINTVKKKVNIEIPEDHVTKEINSFYEDLRKKARIKGFRPGKVPRNILERHFKDYVKAEVIQKLIQETYPNALSEGEDFAETFGVYVVWRTYTFGSRHGKSGHLNYPQEYPLHYQFAKRVFGIEY